MKITIVDRFGSDKNNGGDTLQIEAILSFLKFHSYHVTKTTDLKKYIEKTDLALLFNLTNPYELFYHADLLKQRKKPYIIFPVYWDLDSIVPHSAILNYKSKIVKRTPKALLHYIRGARFFKGNYKELRLTIRQTLKWRCYKNKVKEVLRYAKFICVNSQAEKDHLISKFTLDADTVSKIEVIYNGVNKNVVLELRALHSAPSERYISCAGGIGPRKNQLNLIKAANELKIPIYIIGKPAPSHEFYYNHLLKIAGGNIKFLGYLPYIETQNIIKNSVGHIQPSYIETPGLASMEAFSMGVPVGVSDVGPVKEYFGNDAYYLEPQNVSSIQSVLKKLWENQSIINDKKSMDFLEKFDWNIVLMPLLEVVQKSECVKEGNV